MLLLALSALATVAQRNDKVLNRQYADLKRFHYGFSVGMNFQDMHITNNGFVTEDGEQWVAE
ncbi:MAG: PorT family protein, partial [Muribaculaceae bacterium]|nr:PorT family protein [Muribaculaceae bacterium]